MNYLYKIENKLTGKLYIGVSKNPNIRFNFHLNLLRKNKHHSYKLQNDYNIYGKENFKLKILLSNIQDRDLDNTEIEYIFKYNSYYDGYNCTTGGNINLIGNKAWKGKFGGDHNVAIKVYQYNKNGEFIKEWNSVIEAAKNLGKKKSSLISNCCLGKCLTAYKFIWKYKYEGNLLDITIRKHKGGKPVLMICPYSNKIIRSFNSSKEAEVLLNQKKNKIYLVCQGKRNTWAGFKWRYK